MKQYPFLRTGAIIIILIIVIAAVIKAKVFLAPIALGILFAYLLYPVARFLEKKVRLSRGIADFLTVIFGLGIIVLFFIFLTSQVQNVAKDLPNLQKKAASQTEKIGQQLEKLPGVSFGEGKPLQKLGKKVFSSGGNF
jgi:predicted PurR-regulated permease PerM